MEEISSNQGTFGSFADKISGIAFGNPDKISGTAFGIPREMELHNASTSSETAQVSLNVRQSSPVISDASIHRGVRFSANDNLPNEQLLASALEDLNLSFKDSTVDRDANRRNVVSMNNGHAITQDVFRCSSPIRPETDNFINVPGIPYKPSAISVSPFQQQLCIDEQSQAYTPYQQVGSNIWRHNDIDTQRYPLRRPEHIYRVRSNQPVAARSSTKLSTMSYLGTPNSPCVGHGSDDSYWNSSVIQKGNNQLNAAFMNNCPCMVYPYYSCQNGKSCQIQQAETFTYPYEVNHSSRDLFQHQILDKVSRSFPEKIPMRLEGVNSIRNIKSGSVINGFIENNQRMNYNGHNNLLDVQCNDSLYLAVGSPQLKYNSMDEVAGRISLLAKDQDGCRFLQRIFTEGNQEDAKKVFAEIIDHIGELMIDPFGNYLVQKILEECNDDQRTHIIYEITNIPGKLIKICCNMHGTRAIQKVIETIKTSDQVSMIVSALIPGAVTLMTDANGSHVAHRCLQKLLPEYKAFLLNAAILYYFDLAKDRQGCCILQKCIDHANEEQKYQLLYNITSSVLTLSEDQYGNYVIQYILDLDIPWAMAKILDELKGHYGYLSMQKCSSHVVEKCLTRAEEPKRVRIINELMNDPKLLHIMLDQYGNYVIQTALRLSKGAVHADLIGAIKPHIAALQTNMFGKRVLSRTYLKNKHY